MNLQYSNTINAVYIDLLGDVAVARTEELDAGTLVDLDAEGRVVGIELINPARPWPLDEALERFTIDAEDAAALSALRAVQALSGSVSVRAVGSTGASAELQLA